eukprot:5060039-Pleurochrysis_carterae.AAC.1
MPNLQLTEPNLTRRPNTPSACGIGVSINPCAKNRYIAPDLLNLTRLRVIATLLQPRFGCETRNFTASHVGIGVITTPQQPLLRSEEGGNEPLPYLAALIMPCAELATSFAARSAWAALPARCTSTP